MVSSSFVLRRNEKVPNAERTRRHAAAHMRNPPKCQSVFPIPDLASIVISIKAWTEIVHMYTRHSRKTFQPHQSKTFWSRGFYRKQGNCLCAGCPYVLLKIVGLVNHLQDDPCCRWRGVGHDQWGGSSVSNKECVYHPRFVRTRPQGQSGDVSC